MSLSSPITLLNAEIQVVLEGEGELRTSKTEGQNALYIPESVT